MKLKNKKTGMIVEKYPDRFVINSGEQIRQYDSLAELNAEWEDYEEPKECDYWYIEANGEILQCHKPKYINHLLDRQKEIGNYFETREEAEKAVEKLKAWKRLKDKGFKLGRWQFLYDTSGIWVQCTLVPGIVDDLDILFGGEE